MVRRVVFVRRKEGMTPEEFWAHYTGPHATIVRRLPGLRQLALSRPVGPQAAQWDAVGELWFDSVEAVEQAFADPDIAAQLRADRPLFLGASEVVIVDDDAIHSLASGGWSGHRDVGGGRLRVQVGVDGRR